MQKHTKIYMDYFGYGEQDFIPCENCGKNAVDIHHISPKGMGGGKEKDYIENLIGLCRKDHELAHAGYFSKNNLTMIHKYFMLKHAVKHK